MQDLIAWDAQKAAQLRELREANEQSQGDVAHALGTWPNTVSRWELFQAVPARKNIRRLMEIYPGLVA